MQLDRLQRNSSRSVVAPNMNTNTNRDLLELNQAVYDVLARVEETFPVPLPRNNNNINNNSNRILPHPPKTTTTGNSHSNGHGNDSKSNGSSGSGGDSMSATSRTMKTQSSIHTQMSGESAVAAITEPADEQAIRVMTWNLVCTLRRGKRHDVARVVEDLLQLYRLGGPGVTSMLKELRGSGVLQMLVSAFGRSSDWPEGEILISRAIAILVSHEESIDAIRQGSQEILLALQIILLRPNTPTSNSTTATSTSTSNTSSSQSHMNSSQEKEKEYIPSKLATTSSTSTTSNNEKPSTSMSTSTSHRSVSTDSTLQLKVCSRTSSANSVTSMVFADTDTDAGNDNDNDASSTAAGTDVLDSRVLVAAAIARLALLLSERLKRYDGSRAATTSSSSSSARTATSCSSSISMELRNRLPLGGANRPVGADEPECRLQRFVDALITLILTLCPIAVSTAATRKAQTTFSPLGLNTPLNLPLPPPLIVPTESETGMKGFLNKPLPLASISRSISLSDLDYNVDTSSLGTATGTGTGLGIGMGKGGRAKSNSYAPIPEGSKRAAVGSLGGGGGGVGFGVGGGGGAGRSGRKDFGRALSVSSDLDLASKVEAFDTVTVLCSMAICHLAQSVDSRAILVQRSVLSLLVGWLDQATLLWLKKLKEASTLIESGKAIDIAVNALEVESDGEDLSDGDENDDRDGNLSPGSRHAMATATADGVALRDLVNNCCATVAFLTGANVGCMTLDEGASNNNSHQEDTYLSFCSERTNYTIGWIDAQVIAEGLPFAIARFLQISCPNPSGKNDFHSNAINSGSYFLPHISGINLANALCSLSSRPQNRQFMLNNGVPYSLCCLLVDAATRGARRKERDRNLTNRVRDEESSKIKLRGEEEEEEKYLSIIASATCNSLSHFISDKMLATPTTPCRGSSILDLFRIPSILDAICSVIALKRGPARLAALRLVSMLVEWSDVLVALYEHRVTDALIVVAADADEEGFYIIPDYADTVHNGSASGMGNGGVPKPRPAERSSSAGSSNSAYNRGIVEDVDLEAVEETMRACLSLALICQAKPIYSVELFEKGLMKIMLRIVRSSYVEIHRQALRCVSAMCSVVSLFATADSYAHLQASPFAMMDTSTTSNNNDIFVTSPFFNGTKLPPQEALRKHRSVLQDHDLAFVEALQVLSQDVRAPSHLVQGEALKGLSCLAVDDQLRVGIVEGPLKTIISLLVDPGCELEVRARAEDVLVNIGFRNGRKDLEIVGNDYQLLSDWFYMRRSLTPQVQAVQIIKQWQNALYLGEEEAEKRALTHYFSEIAPYIGHSVLGRQPSRLYGCGLDGEGLFAQSSLDSYDVEDVQPILTQNSPQPLPPLVVDLRDTVEAAFRGIIGRWMSPQTHHHHHGGTSPQPPYTTSTSAKSDHTGSIARNRELISETDSPKPSSSANHHQIQSPTELLSHNESSSSSSPRSVPNDVRKEMYLDFIQAFDAWQMLRQGAGSRAPDGKRMKLHGGNLHSHSGTNLSYGHSAGSSPYGNTPMMSPRDTSSYGTGMGHGYYGGGGGGGSHYPQPPPLKRVITPFTEIFHKYVRFCSGRNAVQRVLDEEDAEMRELHSSSPQAMTSSSSKEGQYHHHYGGTATASSAATSNGSRNGVSSNDYDKDVSDSLPPRVDDLLELFFPSKMHRFYLKDMVSLGIVSSETSTEDSPLFTDRIRYHLSTPTMKAPNPHNFKALLLPARTYLSFKREGRVVERILEEFVAYRPATSLASSSESESVKLPDLRSTTACFDTDMGPWALSFRDSHFHGEFHESLLATLHRCPKIVSVNFASKMQPPDGTDDSLGVLAGNFPASISFATFECALSNDALKMMCVLLRTKNAAFKPRQEGSSARRGLVGLAVKGHSFDVDDTKHMLELLDPWGSSDEYATDAACPNRHHHHHRLRQSPHSPAASHTVMASPAIVSTSNVHVMTPIPDSRRSWSDMTMYEDLHQGQGGQGHPVAVPVDSPASSSAPSSTKRAIGVIDTDGAGIGIGSSENRPLDVGLLYLDLSDNKLTDVCCANLIRAASRGPLEGLELAGNNIGRGLVFADSCHLTLSNQYSHLRYLGLAGTGISAVVLLTLFDVLESNSSLTSLDISNNSLLHSNDIKESIRQCLRRNRSLRQLDLSNNKFTVDTLKGIHLGLLENDTLLLLYLYGNSIFRRQDQDLLCLVKEKLKDNRRLYGHLMDASHHSHFMTHAFSESNLLGPRSNQHPVNSNNINSNISQIRSGIHSNNNSSSNHPPMNIPGAVDVVVVATSFKSHAEVPTDTTINGSSAHAMTLAEATIVPTIGDTTATATTTATAAAAEMNSTPSTSSTGGVVMAVPVATEVDENDISSSSSSFTLKNAALKSNGPSLFNGTMNGTGNGSGTGTVPIRLPPTTMTEVAVGMTAAVAIAAAKTGSVSVPLTVPSLSSSNPQLHLTNTVNTVNSRRPNSWAGNGSSSRDDMDVNVIVHGGSHGNGSSSTGNDTSNDTSLGNGSGNDEIKESQGETALNVLCVLFSAPLAWQDRSYKLNPIEMLDVAGERETLLQVFREAQRDVTVSFDFATTDTLRTAVTLGCRALHFSGHGHPHCLNFEDGRSGLQLVTVQKLRELCQAGGLRLDFVFVSACYSRRAGEAFADAGVPHVVCVNVDAQLLDTAAVAFTRAFYLSLVVGDTVRQAFEIGKQAVVSSPRISNSAHEGDKFVLLPEDKDHDSPVFLAPRVSSWPLKMKKNIPQLLQKLPASASHLPQPPEDFEGREVDMHRTITALLSRRMVSLVGEEGIGKTAVAAAVSLYVSERSMFPDGVVYVRLVSVQSHADVLNTLQNAILHGPRTMSMRLRNLISLSEQQGGCRSPDVEPFSDNNIQRSTSYSSASDVDSDFDNDNLDPVYKTEELLLVCLTTLHTVLILDHANAILKTGVDAATDFRMFIGRVLERCKKVKILVTSTSTLGMSDLGGFGVVENSVTVGPLTLRASLRLFARLTPFLETENDRKMFVLSVLPSNGRQDHVTIQSRELTPVAGDILRILKGGHPAKIIKLACESDATILKALIATAGNADESSLLGFVSAGDRMSLARGTSSSSSSSQMAENKSQKEPSQLEFRE
eukprot:gene472-882_t